MKVITMHRVYYHLFSILLLGASTSCAQGVAGGIQDGQADAAEARRDAEIVDARPKDDARPAHDASNEFAPNNLWILSGASAGTGTEPLASLYKKIPVSVISPHPDLLLSSTATLSRSSSLTEACFVTFFIRNQGSVTQCAVKATNTDFIGAGGTVYGNTGIGFAWASLSVPTNEPSNNCMAPTEESWFFMIDASCSFSNVSEIRVGSVAATPPSTFAGYPTELVNVTAYTSNVNATTTSLAFPISSSSGSTLISDYTLVAFLSPDGEVLHSTIVAPGDLNQVNNTLEKTISWNGESTMLMLSTAKIRPSLSSAKSGPPSEFEAARAASLYQAVQELRTVQAEMLAQ